MAQLSQDSKRSVTMWARSAITVVVSVVLSVFVMLMFDRQMQNRSGASSSVRARRIELVDDDGNVRAAIKMSEGRNVTPEPEIVLLDEAGQESTALRLQGLTFNSNDPQNPLQGILELGYLELDDTVPHDVSSTGWGLSVHNGNHRSTTLMGISTDGKPWGISAAR